MCIRDRDGPFRVQGIEHPVVQLLKLFTGRCGKFLFKKMYHAIV